jgi:hypothetical protein
LASDISTNGDAVERNPCEQESVKLFPGPSLHGYACTLMPSATG